MYREFASVYDRLMSQVDYAQWAAYYKRLLLQLGVNDGARVLEAACGTGNLSIHLAKDYQLTAGDSSAEMLSRAAEKAKSKGLKIPFLQQDMRSLHAHRLQDAVIAACDAVNYLLSPEDLRRFFSGAAKVLRPGGVLAFDVSTVYKLQHILGNKPQVHLEDDICYLWENAWQSQGKKLHMNLAVFTLGAKECWQRINETQVQRAWTITQLKQGLNVNGFSQIGVFGEFTMDPPTRTAQRVHLVAAKSEKYNIIRKRIP